MCRLSRNLGAWISWNPQGLSTPVMGLLYRYLHLIDTEGNNLKQIWAKENNFSCVQNDWFMHFYRRRFSYFYCQEWESSDTVYTIHVSTPVKVLKFVWYNCKSMTYESFKENTWHHISGESIFHSHYCDSFISFSSLSYNRSKVSSEANSPHSVI